MNIETARHDAELRLLCQRFRVRRLDLFGSAALGQARPDSDLDLLVEFGPIPSGNYADNYFGLLEALEQLLGRPVDLVVASAIKNPYFLESVEKTRTLLYVS